MQLGLLCVACTEIVLNIVATHWGRNTFKIACQTGKRPSVEFLCTVDLKVVLLSATD